MGEIIDIYAREILDSRGNPTVEVDVTLDSGILGRAQVPSGASTGEREAIELRDNEKRYNGKGVEKAVDNVNNIIAKDIIGMESTAQIAIDKELIEIDGTENKSKLGANAILGVSMGCCIASADEICLPLYQYIGGTNARTLPVPMMNVINGGVHADNNLDIQEFMIVPVGTSFKESLRMGAETFHSLKRLLKKERYSTGVGDEGGFAPNLSSNKSAIEFIIKGIESAGYTPGKDIYIALDCAASSFYKKGKYEFEGKRISRETLLSFYEQIVRKFPVISIEDGFAEGDWEGWKASTKRLKDKIQIVGDDVFVTNVKIFKKGIEQGIANSILIKLNQIGTVSETLDCIEMAKKAGYTRVISHRSGETESSFIADLAVATNTGLIKTGSASRSERICKYNQLLRIEEELGDNAVFRGVDAFYSISRK